MLNFDRRTSLCWLCILLLSGPVLATEAKKERKPAQTDMSDTVEPNLGDMEFAPESESAPQPDTELPPKVQAPEPKEEIPLAPEESVTTNVVTDTTPEPTETLSVESGKSEKIFDWEKYEGQSEVPHPFAKEGLIRITKDNTYIYKVDESEQKRAAAIRIGMLDLVNLENPEQAGQVGATFDENYDQTENPAILFDMEWTILRTPIGHWSLTTGAGLFVAQGHGHFVNGDPRIPKELFTFFLVPVNIGAIYRLKIWNRQLLVPYGAGGGTLFGFSEIRDDHKGPKFGGALGAYWAVGAGFNLTYFDRFSRAQLDREYGINAVYLTAEYRSYISLNKKYDLSSDYINGGLVIEY